MKPKEQALSSVALIHRLHSSVRSPPGSGDRPGRIGDDDYAGASSAISNFYSPPENHTLSNNRSQLGCSGWRGRIFHYPQRILAGHSPQGSEEMI